MFSSISRCFIQWPFDKQLTLIFPVVIFHIALITNSIYGIQPTENKAALFSSGLFLILLLLGYRYRPVSMPKLDWFLREFWPVPAILLGYLTMRIFRLELAIQTLGIPQQDELMIQLDQILFGQALPLLLQPLISPAMTLLMESAYLHFYYLLPIGSLIYFHLKGEQQLFLRLRRGLIFALTGGFMLYFLLPVEGPISFIQNQFNSVLVPGHQIVTDAVNSFRFAYDCFPSSHTAIPWVTLFIGWQYFNLPQRLIVLAMTLTITCSTVYLRYHYGADVIAGFIWAMIISLIVCHSEQSCHTGKIPGAES